MKRSIKPKSRALTKKQAAAAGIIADRVSSGEPLTKALIADAHDSAYGLKGDRKKAQTYAGKNLASPAFLASLSLDDPDCQKELKVWLWACLRGTLPTFPKDKDLMIVAAKLLARATFAEKHSVQFEHDELDNKTMEELEYHAAHDYEAWPTPGELEFHKQHGKWPDEQCVGGIQ